MSYKTEMEQQSCLLGCSVYCELQLIDNDTEKSVWLLYFYGTEQSYHTLPYSILTSGKQQQVISFYDEENPVKSHGKLDKMNKHSCGFQVIWGGCAVKGSKIKMQRPKLGDQNKSPAGSIYQEYVCSSFMVNINLRLGSLGLFL